MRAARVGTLISASVQVLLIAPRAEYWIFQLPRTTTCSSGSRRAIALAPARNPEFNHHGRLLTWQGRYTLVHGRRRGR